MTPLRVLLLVALLVVGAAAPYGVSPFVLGIATSGLIIGLLAVSVDLMGGYGGHISFGSAGIFSAAAYGLGFAANHGVGTTSALAGGATAGLFVTLISGAMVWRVKAAPFVMVTLAQGMVVFSLAQNWIDVTGGDAGLAGINRPLGATEDWQFYYLTLVVVAVITLATWGLTRTRFGLALKALRDSEERASSMGYNTGAIRFTAFCCHGVIATIAGILFGLYSGFITPSSSALATSGQAIAAMVIGGAGTLVGPLLGGLFVAFLSQYVSIHVEQWLVILGATYIAVVIYLPSGFVGALNQRLPGRWRRSDRTEPPPGRAGDEITQPLHAEKRHNAESRFTMPNTASPDRTDFTGDPTGRSSKPREERHD